MNNPGLELRGFVLKCTLVELENAKRTTENSGHLFALPGNPGG